MLIERSYRKTTYYNGRTEVFDPFICWTVSKGIIWIRLRNNYGIGILWGGYRIGIWSRICKKFIEIGSLTFYVSLGETLPHNPRTGEIYKHTPNPSQEGNKDVLVKRGITSHWIQKSPPGRGEPEIPSREG